MFVRTVECQAKHGESKEIRKKVKRDVLPVLQEQPGFVDLVVLGDKSNFERLVCMSFWNSQEDADRYHYQHYETIRSMLRSVLESSPTLETFTVEASTVHRIAVAKAA
jgi:heme-degrading monooxygenase HmoA